jgi:hypothetical protein
MNLLLTFYLIALHALVVKEKTEPTAILILTDLGAATESCRAASTNTVNICLLSGILWGVGAGLRARPVKISFS